MDYGDDDYGGLDDLFVPRHPRTGDPLPNTEPWWNQDWPDEDWEESTPAAPQARRRRRLRDLLRGGNKAVGERRARSSRRWLLCTWSLLQEA